MTDIDADRRELASQLQGVVNGFRKLNPKVPDSELFLALVDCVLSVSGLALASRSLEEREIMVWALLTLVSTKLAEQLHILSRLDAALPNGTTLN